MDRRFSKTLPKLELDTVVAERIINLLLESDAPAEGGVLENTELHSKDSLICR